MKYEEIKFGKLDDVLKAYDEAKCDVLTADVSQLYAAAAAADQAGRAASSCPTSSRRSRWRRWCASATTTG